MFLLGTLVILITACTAVSSNTPTLTATAVASRTMPAKPLKATANAATEVEVLNTDDRSAQLRALTDSWHTNWTRHSINYSEILSGGPPRDGIPSIDTPKFESVDKAALWLTDNEPVVVLEINDDARAYPLSIITWHEIVNDEVGGEPVVVTFCPLCNSAIAFDRRVGERTLTFGVSGLLRNSDLIMYDRTTETLWQQFTGEGIIGDLTGAQLIFLPTGLVSFRQFRDMYPEGIVLSRETGFNRDYGRNPYVGYDSYQNPLSAGGDLVLFQDTVDARLSAAERVVTVSLPDEGVDIAYPLTILSAQGVINDSRSRQHLVVFYTAGTSSALDTSVIANGADVGATGVFDPNLNGQLLIFRQRNDQIVDEQTGSVWNIFGRAISGELTGQQLKPIVHGDHFWFSWAAFRPDTIIYQLP